MAVIAAALIAVPTAAAARADVELPFVGGDVDVVYAAPPPSRVCHLGVDRNRPDRAPTRSLSKRSDPS